MAFGFVGRPDTPSALAPGLLLVTKPGTAVVKSLPIKPLHSTYLPDQLPIGPWCPLLAHGLRSHGSGCATAMAFLPLTAIETAA